MADSKLVPAMMLPLAPLLAVAALAAPSVATNPTPPSPAPVKSGLEERVHVQLVQFNFIARDKKGNPVSDLKPDEVEISEGKARRKVAFLQRYYAAAERPKGDAGTSGPVPRTAVAPGRWIVLVIDDYASTQGTKLLAVRAAREFLDHDLKPNDRVAIVKFTGRTELVQTFTGDAHALRAAIDYVSGNLERAVEDRFGAVDTLMDGVQSCAAGSNVLACVQALADAYDADRTRETESFLVALTELTRSLEPIPDPKAVVLVSEGFARTPSSDVFDVALDTVGIQLASALVFPQQDRVDRGFDELAAAAAKARVSFFTVNPGGATRAAATSARRGSPLGGTGVGNGIDVFRRSAQNYEQGLAELARRTGGTASLDPNVGEAVRAAVDLASGLYTVGYYLADDEELFRTHDVKIRIARKGVRAETRREVPRFPDQPPLTGELTVAPDPCSERHRRIAVLRLRVDRSRLTFERVDKKMSSNFSLYLRVLADGRAEPLYDDFKYLNVTHSDEEMARGDVPDPVIQETLLVPCAALTVVAQVTDAESGATGEFTARIAP